MMSCPISAKCLCSLFANVAWERDERGSLDLIGNVWRFFRSDSPSTQSTFFDEKCICMIFLRDERGDIDVLGKLWGRMKGRRFELRGRMGYAAHASESRQRKRKGPFDACVEDFKQARIAHLSAGLGVLTAIFISAPAGITLGVSVVSYRMLQALGVETANIHSQRRIEALSNELAAKGIAIADLDGVMAPLRHIGEVVEEHGGVGALERHLEEREAWQAEQRRAAAQAQRVHELIIVLGAHRA